MRAPLTVAVAQPVCVVGDVAANAAAHAAAVRATGARLVVFPELSLTGYDLEAPGLHVDDDALAPVVEACAATGATALVGAPAIVGGAPHIATVAVTGTGAAVAYAKANLGGDEPARFTAGRGPAVLVVDGWRIGLGICKDTRIPEHIEATLALGVHLYAAGLVHHPHELAEQDRRAARIIGRGNVPVAFASAAGPVGGDYPETAGHSCIWAGNGAVLAQATAAAGDIARAAVAP